MTNAVALAARELDNLIPGWAELIDPEKVSLYSPTSCILGQLADTSQGRALVNAWRSHPKVRQEISVYGTRGFGPLYAIAKVVMPRGATDAFFQRVVVTAVRYTTHEDLWDQEIFRRVNSAEAKLAKIIATAKVEPTISDDEIEAITTEWSQSPVVQERVLVGSAA